MNIPSVFWIVPFASVCALIMAFYFYKSMMREDEGTERMREVAGYVRTGAMAYLRQQYKVVIIIFVVISLIFAFMSYVLHVQNPWVPFAFITGGLFSGLCGFFGMKTATYASARTANAARHSLNKGLKIAFRSGAVMGLVVVGLGLMDIALWFVILNAFYDGEANALVTITTTMLVILSGLGYPVWIDLAKNIKMTIQSKGKRPVGRTITRLSLQSKIVLTMTLFLLTLGTLGFYLLEHHNPATMGTLNAAGKFQAAFFQSVTTRTAGFASISQSGLTNGSKLLASMLMIIGGSPAGTAGGIKTTTVAVLLLTAISVLRGNKDTECYGRKITFEIIRVGITITLVTFVFWLFGVTVMTVIEPQQKVLDLMFEATSAMATVGLTADLTPVLSDISHVVLMLMMYIGRIGPMTMALIFSGHVDKKNQFRTLPEAKIMVG